MDAKFLSGLFGCSLMLVMLVITAVSLLNKEGKPFSNVNDIPKPVRPIALVMLSLMLVWLNPWAVKDREQKEIAPEFNAIFATPISDARSLESIDYAENAKFGFRFDLDQPAVLRHPEQFTLIRPGSPHWTIYISPDDQKWISKCRFYEGPPVRSHKGEHLWSIHGPGEDNIQKERIWIFTDEKDSRYFVWGNFDVQE